MRGLLLSLGLALLACHSRSPKHDNGGATGSNHARLAASFASSKDGKHDDSRDGGPPDTEPVDPLSAVDWAHKIASDPALGHPEPPSDGCALGPYVETKGNTPTSGYARVDQALVLDLLDQRKQLIIIPLYSGGTGLDRALLVYLAQAGSMKLLTWFVGDRLQASTLGNDLLVREPAFAGWEPHCCASGIRETRYKFDNGHLVTTHQIERPDPFAKVATVNEYYRRISQRRYREAYAFLSLRYKEKLPFERWLSEQSDTAATTATTRQQNDGSVAISFEARRNTGANSTSKPLEGRWSLVWNDEAKQWFLDAVHYR